MDPVEVQDWTRGEIRALRDKCQRSIDGQEPVMLLTEWEKRLLVASLEIACDL